MKNDSGFGLKFSIASLVSVAFLCSVMLLGFLFYLGAKYFVPYPDVSDYLQKAMIGLFGGLVVGLMLKDWESSGVFQCGFDWIGQKKK